MFDPFIFRGFVAESLSLEDTTIEDCSTPESVMRDAFTEQEYKANKIDVYNILYFIINLKI